MNDVTNYFNICVLFNIRNDILFLSCTQKIKVVGEISRISFNEFQEKIRNLKELRKAAFTHRRNCEKLIMLEYHGKTHKSITLDKTKRSISVKEKSVDDMVKEYSLKVEEFNTQRRKFSILKLT